MGTISRSHNMVNIRHMADSNKAALAVRSGRIRAAAVRSAAEAQLQGAMQNDPPTVCGDTIDVSRVRHRLDFRNTRRRKQHIFHDRCELCFLKWLYRKNEAGR